MDKIKMVDLRGQYLRIKEEVDKAMDEVLLSTAFIQGPQVEDFARALGDYLHSPHVVTCGNGTDALQIAMMALDLKPGDEVILPAYTYVATAEVIALLGLTPVFVDVDETTFNINAQQIEGRITSRTKAIVAVHLYGQCADMEQILTIARQHNIPVIEDAAQALGTDYIFSDGRRKKAGTIGTIGTTSFFPTKTLGAFGDGGAIFAADPELARRIKMIANHGQRIKYRHELVGVNSRLDTLQAAILRVKLNHLETYIDRRINVAASYDTHLTGHPSVKIPRRTPYSSHVFHQYTLTVRDGKRDDLQRYLAGQQIPSVIYYPIPLHLQPAYVQTNCPEGSFPSAEKLSKAVISLPIHTEMDEEQLNYICKTLKAFA